MEPSARSDLARFICFLCRDWCKNIDQLEKLLSGLQLISILQISLVIYPYPSISGSHSWSNIVCVLLVCFSNDQEKYFLADEGKWRCLASYHTNKNVHLMQYLCTPPPFHCKIPFKVPKKWFIINCSVNRYALWPVVWHLLWFERSFGLTLRGVRHQVPQLAPLHAPHYLLSIQIGQQ